MPDMCRWTIATLVVNTRLTQASGSAWEPEAALAMAAEIAGQHRVTLGADKGWADRKESGAGELRAHQVTPHFARKVYSAIDCRTTRHPGYAISQVKRKRVEEIFGWFKTIAGLRKTRHRGADRVGWDIYLRSGRLQLGEDAHPLANRHLKRTPKLAGALLRGPLDARSATLTTTNHG